MTVLRLGDSGDGVAELTGRLVALGHLSPDGVDGVDGVHGAADAADGAPPRFDAAVERAVRAFQQQRGLRADGVVGASTYRALEEARWRLGDRVLVHLPGRVQTGDDVLALQRQLLDLGFKTGRVDGRFGHVTEGAVREFQRNIGVPADGTCGPATLKALARLAPRVSGGRPNALRAEERIRTAGPRLTGKVVVIDPAPSENAEARERADAACTDLARRVEGRLGATGVQAFLSVPRADHPDDEAARAAVANRTDAHLLVSVLVDAAADTAASGVSTYFWGIDSHGVRSWVGERFAGLVQREVVARTGLADLRTHARSWDLLRMTTMPAVCVELTCGHDGLARLDDAGFRDAVVDGIVVAVQRLYLSPEADPHTGVLDVRELAALRPPQGRPDGQPPGEDPNSR